MGGRNWPECSQSCRGCTFLALSGLRMTHSRAKPLKAFPSSDLEICPTQQVTKTQLQASSHKIAFITLFFSFSFKILASCCVRIRTSRGPKDKGLFTWLPSTWLVSHTCLWTLRGEQFLQPSSPHPHTK